MPILGSLANASIQSYGSRGVVAGGSAYYNISGDGLYMSPGTPFAYGTGDFTIEMWVYPTTVAQTPILWHQGGQSSYTYSPGIPGISPGRYTFTDRRYLTLYINTFGQVSLQLGGTDAYRTTANTVTLNSWNHIALVRSSSSVKIFLNGTPTAGAALGSNFSDTSAYVPYIGRFSFTTSQGVIGYISNVRVAKSAYYTTTFNPARTPFTRTSQGASNVQLLLNQLTSSSLLKDSSSNNLTVTNVSTTWDSKSPFLVPYVPFAPVTAITVSVTPSVTTVDEGSTVTFTVAGTNTPNGTYYYSIEQSVTELDGADFSSGSLTGSFTMTGNAGSFTITPIKDLATETDSVFSVYVRKDSVTGQVLGNTAEITVVDVSITPAFTVAPTSVNEGSSASFTVENVGPNGTYYWTVLHSTTVAADFTSTSGSFAVSGSVGGIDNGTGSFSVPLAADLTTEGSQTFQVQVRSGSTSGTVILTSSAVTVTDTSLTPSVSSISSVNENSASLVFTASNVGPDGTYYWTINNTTTSNADFSAVSGSFTVSGSTGGLDNGSGTFSVTTVPDYLTEGNEAFTVSVRSGSVSGTVIVTSGSNTLVDSSTTVSASGSPTAFNEGASTTITASATAFPNGTYYWTVLNGTTTNADFTATSGSFTVSNSASGSFTVTAATLGGAEAAETFSVQIRTGSTSGTVIATTGTLTINSNAT